MTKTLIFLFIIALLFSSCLSINYGGKKPIFLVDAPNNTSVKRNGKELEIKPLVVFRETTGPKGLRTTTKWRYQGVAFKVKRHNLMEFTSSGKSVQIKFKGNPTLGIVIMVLETPITLGIGPIVDLATTSYFYPKLRYIDVKSILEGTPPRSKKELEKYIRSNSSVSESLNVN